MTLELSTPALLFSTISLLLLAYTNRFLALASIIRKLHADHQASPQQRYVDQIANLRRRIVLIRDMQTLGVASLLCCTVCMGVLFAGWQSAGTFVFSISLVLMAASLTLSIIEIRISIGALDLHLKDMEHPTTKSESLETNVPAKRRFFRFSISSLMWFSVLVAVIMLWMQDRAKHDKALASFVGRASTNWSIDQLLDEPNTTTYGDIVTAWASATPDGGKEFVVVEFPWTVMATGVEIHENNAAGAVTEVYSVSATGNETLLWQGTDPCQGNPLPGGFVRWGGASKINFGTPTSTRRLKIVIDSAKFPGYNEIDAVGLIDSKGDKQWASNAWASSSFGYNRLPPLWYWP